MKFQSTPPVWGATLFPPRSASLWTFQSTPPVWGATIHHVEHGGVAGISIHAPRVGGDRYRPDAACTTL